MQVQARIPLKMKKTIHNLRIITNNNNKFFRPREQGRIQSKFEGGADGSGGSEKLSEFGDEGTLYTTISVPNY